MKKINKGLGDSIEKITEATGIKAVIDKVSKVTGIDCGCEKRKKRLNELFPYSRQFTEDEIKIYEEVLPRTKGTRISAQDQSIMVKLYNKVFNKNKKPSNCGSCVKNTLNSLEKIYENSCKKEE